MIFVEIWSVAEEPEEIKNNKSNVYTLRNRKLKILSDITMGFIEDEHQYMKSLNRLESVTNSQDPDMMELMKTLQASIHSSNEYLFRMSDIREKLVYAYSQKKKVAKLLL